MIHSQLYLFGFEKVDLNTDFTAPNPTQAQTLPP